MRRPFPLLALGALILVSSLLTLGPGGRTLAQEATPIVEATTRKRWRASAPNCWPLGLPMSCRRPPGSNS